MSTTAPQHHFADFLFSIFGKRFRPSLTIMALMLSHIVTAQNILVPSEPDNDGGFNSANVLNTGADTREDNGDIYSVWCWDGETPGFGWDMNGTTFSKELEGNSYVSGLIPEDPDIVIDNAHENVVVVYKLQGRILIEGWAWDYGTSEFWPSWGPHELNSVYEYFETEYPNIDSDKYDQIVIVMQSQASFGHTPEVLAIAADFGGTYHIMNQVSDKAGYQQGKICMQPDVSIFNPDGVGQEEAIVHIVFRYTDNGGDELIIQQAKYAEIVNDNTYSYNSHVIRSSSSSNYLTRPRIASHSFNFPEEASWAAVWEESDGSDDYIMLKSGWRYNSSNQFPNTNWFSLPATVVNDLGNESCENLRPCLTFVHDFIIVPWHTYNCLSSNDLDERDVVVRFFSWEGIVINSTQNIYSRLNGYNNASKYFDENQTIPSIAGRFNSYDMLYMYYTNHQNNTPPDELTVYKHIPIGQYSLKNDDLVSIKVFPNPVLNYLNISLSDGLNFSKYEEIFVYSTLGNIVHHEYLDTRFPKSNVTIDLSNLPKGLYVLEFSNQHSSSSHLIVKD